MKERIELSADTRSTGKANSRALRREGRVPAVVYGASKNAILYVEEKAIKKYNTRAFENALYTLKSTANDLNNTVVLMKDVTVHPVSQRPIHVDFYEIDLKKPIRGFVEVRFDGKAIGLSEGGLLNVVTREVEVECLPTDIPEAITADVSSLGIGQAIHVSDLSLPAGAKMISLGHLTVVVLNKEDEKAAATPEVTAAAATTAAAPAAGAAKAPAAGGAKAPAAGTAKAPAKK
jgi:large subunit ribosomal protein L25